MAKNRMLPFGYKVERGAVVLNHEESETVRRVFREYATGTSYKAIAEALTADKIAYTPAKPVWNKNMIARLLQNEDYLGSEKYPPILDVSEFSAAKAAQKQLCYTEPSALRKIGKLLVCGECGASLARRIHANGKTRWYCRNDNTHIPNTVTDEYLLETVSRMLTAIKENPRLLQPSTTKLSDTAFKLARLQNEINDLLEGNTDDEAAVKELIMRLATARYDSCDDAVSMAATLQEQIEKLKQEPDSDMKILMVVADHIQIRPSVTIDMTLKSGQIITEGT